MRKALAITPAGFLVCLLAQAQPTFEKYYQPNSPGYQFNLIELTGHDFFIGVESSAGTVIDPEGNIIQSYYFRNDSVAGIQSAKRSVSNKFYFATGYYGDYCGAPYNPASRHWHPMLGQMDSIGHVISLNRYVMNAGCNNLVSDLSVLHDNGLITWGRDQNFFALKADSNLTHVWSKNFDRHGGFQFIKELPGGDLLAGINLDSAGASVARLDADGNFIWCKSYIREGLIQDCVIESDSLFVITGYTDSLASEGFAQPPPDYDPKLFMMKLNGMGDVQWCKGYDVQPKWYAHRGQRIVKAHDGNYVLLANIGTQQGNFEYRPLLMKTDQNGDTLWTRSAGASGYSYDIITLLASSDGGFLYDGEASGDFGLELGAPYIFKTDSLGHLPCSEQPPPTMVVSDLFPVDSSFTLASIDGAVAIPVFVHDSSASPIPIIDGCTITSLPHFRVQRFQVHPNPNTGHFTVQFKNPLMAESYYSVYDSMSRLLYQRPLPIGKETEEVDLSRFGKGTYLIKFTDRDGVCYERVVVE